MLLLRFLRERALGGLRCGGAAARSLRRLLPSGCAGAVGAEPGAGGTAPSFRTGAEVVLPASYSGLVHRAGPEPTLTAAFRQLLDGLLSADNVKLLLTKAGGRLPLPGGAVRGVCGRCAPSPRLVAVRAAVPAGPADRPRPRFAGLARTLCHSGRVRRRRARAAVTAPSPPRAQWRCGCGPARGPALRPAPPPRPASPYARRCRAMGLLAGWGPGGRLCASSSSASSPPPPALRGPGSSGRRWAASVRAALPSCPCRPAPRCPWRSCAAVRLPPRDAAWTALLLGRCGGRNPRAVAGRPGLGGGGGLPAGTRWALGWARGTRPAACHPARG